MHSRADEIGRPPGTVCPSPSRTTPNRRTRHRLGYGRRRRGVPTRLRGRASASKPRVPSSSARPMCPNSRCGRGRPRNAGGSPRTPGTSTGRLGVVRGVRRRGDDGHVRTRARERRRRLGALPGWTHRPRGLKPQRPDRVPIGPEHSSAWHGLLVLGALTRTVRDAACSSTCRRRHARAPNSGQHSITQPTDSAFAVSVSTRRPGHRCRSQTPVGQLSTSAVGIVKSCGHDDRRNQHRLRPWLPVELDGATPRGCPGRRCSHAGSRWPRSPHAPRCKPGPARPITLTRAGARSRAAHRSIHQRRLRIGRCRSHSPLRHARPSPRRLPDDRGPSIIAGLQHVRLARAMERHGSTSNRRAHRQRRHDLPAAVQSPDDRTTSTPCSPSPPRSKRPTRSHAGHPSPLDRPTQATESCSAAVSRPCRSSRVSCGAPR